MYWPRRNEALQKLRDMGLIPLESWEPDIQDKLIDVENACMEMIRPHVESGKLLYIGPYRRIDQPEPDYDPVAECVIFPDLTAAIVISTMALDGSHDYAVLCMLHELTHLKYGDHDATFTAYLDTLIDRYNSITGKQLVNDMAALPS